MTPQVSTHAPARSSATPARYGPLGGLLASHAVSLGGNALTSVALPWFVLSTTGSAGQTGLTAFMGALPLFLGAFFGGAVVDRLGHRRAGIAADIASGLTVALIPLLYATTGLAFWQLLLLVFLGALLDVPGATARQALLPEAARLAQLRPERANAIYETLEGFALLGGPLLGGVLIGFVGPANVLWVNAATFALSALALALALPRAALPAGGAEHSYGRQIREGLRFVLHNRLLRSIGLLFTLVSLLLAPLFSVVMPVYIAQVYGDALLLGLFVATIGGGGILGAVLYGLFGHLLPRRTLFLGGLLGIGLVVAAIAVLPSYPVLLAAAFVGGVANGPINPLVTTVLQARTPPELRGRVFGTITGLAMVSTPVGVLGAGFALELFGLQPTLVAMAAGFLALTLGALALPALHEMNSQDEPQMGGSARSAAE
jgi:MFS family permease